jgi:hypothetical protein
MRRIRFEKANSPDNGRLDDVFPILVDSLQNIRGFGLDFGFDRLIQVDADLCRESSVSQYLVIAHYAQENNLLGLKV